MGSQTVGHDWATLIFFCLFVCLFLLWWARLSEVVILSADDLFVFCFVCCLDEAFCTGCYWWLGAAESCIQVVSFVWVLSMWYSLMLALWLPRVLEWVLPLQRLRAWSLCDSGSGSLMRLPWNWLELQSSKGLAWAAEPNCRQAADPRAMKKQSVQGSRHSTNHGVPWQHLAKALSWKKCQRCASRCPKVLESLWSSHWVAGSGIRENFITEV